MSEQVKGKSGGIYFKVTDEERRLIKQRMALMGVRNMSAYIRKKCIDGYIVQLQIKELDECAKLLRYMSNNVNQIARRVNSGGGVYPDEVGEICGKLTEASGLFGSILEQLIDTALGQGCKNFDSFLAGMKAAGTEVKRGKHLAFKIPNGKRFVRCDSLGADYSEAAIMERIPGKRIVVPRAKATVKSKPNLLIDIQVKMQQINSPGFERWAKIFNLKEMAKTVMYLQENGLTDLGELEKVCDTAVQKFNDLSDRTKAASARMKGISELQRHIGAYGKTREIYAQYRKLTGRKRNKFYEQHTSDILTCQAAKRYFDSFGLKKLPSIQSLKQEYATLQAENKKRYSEYKQAREKMIEFLTAKNNVERILGVTEKEKKCNRQQEVR